MSERAEIVSLAAPVADAVPDQLADVLVELVLDTVPGESGHRLYIRAGRKQTGIVPDYALFPNGRPCDTAIMWKRLET